MLSQVALYDSIPGLILYHLSCKLDNNHGVDKSHIRSMHFVLILILYLCSVFTDIKTNEESSSFNLILIFSNLEILFSN